MAATHDDVRKNDGPDEKEETPAVPPAEAVCEQQDHASEDDKEGAQA
jgi:hypothetical protein